MSDRVRMVPYEARGDWSATPEQAIGYVRCEEIIEAGSGVRKFRVVRTVEEAVSGNCDTEAEAWAGVTLVTFTEARHTSPVADIVQAASYEGITLESVAGSVAGTVSGLCRLLGWPRVKPPRSLGKGFQADEFFASEAVQP